MTLENTIDALINLDKIISSTELSFVEVDGYLKNYQIVGKVLFPFLTETKITADTISLNIPDDQKKQFEDKNILSDDFWTKYFIKAESMFSSSNSISVKDDDDDYALLTKEFVLSNTAFTSKHTLSFNHLKSTKEFSDSDLKKTSAEALPISEIKKIVPMISDNSPVELDFSSIEASIFVGSNGGNISINKKGISFNDFNFTLLTLKSKNLKGFGMIINEEFVKDFILHKKDVLPNTVTIPKNSSTNIFQFKDIFKLPYIKSGDNVLMEVKEYSDSTELKDAVQLHYNDNPTGIEFEKNLLVSKDNLNTVVNELIPFFSVFGT